MGATRKDSAILILIFFILKPGLFQTDFFIMSETDAVKILFPI
jgi:hypothetical protein